MAAVIARGGSRSAHRRHLIGLSPSVRVVGKGVIIQTLGSWRRVEWGLRTWWRCIDVPWVKGIIGWLGPRCVACKALEDETCTDDVQYGSSLMFLFFHEN